MQNIAILLTLLLLPYWALIPAHISEPVRGRIGIALVFAFSRWALHQNLGNDPDASFFRADACSADLRHRNFRVTGRFTILIPALSRYTGIALCLFLLLILPSNVYAAFQRIDFGGHGAGPVYLL